MNTIQPQQNNEVPKPFVDASPESITAVKPETIEAIKYLELTDSLYDEEVMGKVEEITDFLGDGDLQEIDTKLGNPYDMTKLDKIYSYIRLMKQSGELQKKEALLDGERKKYDHFI